MNYLCRFCASGALRILGEDFTSAARGKAMVRNQLCHFQLMQGKKQCLGY